MSGSTLIVAANALMLKRTKLAGIKRTVKAVKAETGAKTPKIPLKGDVAKPALQA